MSSTKFDSILFIAPFFYNYEIDILNELKKHSHKVDSVFYSFGKHKIPWKKKKLERQISEQKQRILELIKTNKYDILLVIKGEILRTEDIKLFKKINPLSKTINYQWDSLKNLPFNFDFIETFDFKYTFDHVDAANHPNLHLRPLFFTNEFKFNKDARIEYDFATVGGFQNRRVNVINLLKLQFPNAKFKIRLRTTMTLNILNNFIKTGGIKRYFHYALFKDLDRTTIANILNKSNVIIDIPSEGQTGLSMRTIEAIGLQKKIITTCKYIKGYDFFNSNNHLVINNKNFIDIKEFMKVPYKVNKELSISKYSLELFISTLLFSKSERYLK